MNFLIVMEKLYNANGNPYHNSTHAADVVQSCAVILDLALKQEVEINDEDLLALIVSCIIHDFCHIGLSNQFLLSLPDSSPISVGLLESYH
eukprot:UN33091